MYNNDKFSGLCKYIYNGIEYTENKKKDVQI